MHEIGAAAYGQVAGVFRPLAHHLAITGILAGTTPGRVFVDDVAMPGLALAWTRHRLYLAARDDAVDGAPRIDDLRGLFVETIYPQAHAAGQEVFILTYAPAGWSAALESVLVGPQVFANRRQYYVCRTLSQDWRRLLPAGFQLVPVDRALLANERLRNRERLAEEMCSERPTVNDFLARSFGVAALCQDEIAGWCLSEYNTATRCEVGIETGEAYRRRGLGTAMALALVEMALGRGIVAVGWDCWARNVPSSATAIRAGFTMLAEEPVFFIQLS
jgi:RimJ/RimL family protein N-acetyltransferase